MSWAPSVGCAALLLEALLGYPGVLFRIVAHPVTWMAAFLSFLDCRLNRERDPPQKRRVRGAMAIGALVFASCATASAVDLALRTTLPSTIALLLLSLAASSCLAQRSLDTHVQAVADALGNDGIVAGRRAVSAIVGRETAALDESGIARAAIESLAESFADGVVAPAFWLVLLGLPGGVAYKAINTADSMIGHRTPRYEAFGFCAAKLDDVVSWPGARLAALWLLLAAMITSGASVRDALRMVRRDARGHLSPNAGWPEAAMAGALGIQLGGPRTYAGRQVHDEFIGDGTRHLDATSIRAALQLYRTACVLQIGTVLATTLVIALWP